MSTQKRKFVVEIEMTSQCSDADLYGHIEDFVKTIKSQIEDATTHSWETSIGVGYDESYPVEINVEIKSE